MQPRSVTPQAGTTGADAAQDVPTSNPVPKPSGAAGSGDDRSTPDASAEDASADGSKEQDADDAGSPDTGDGCERIEISANAGTIYEYRFYSITHPIGGRVDLRVTGSSTLATLNLTLVKNDPAFRLSPKTSGTTCDPAVRLTVVVTLISEDGLLDEGVRVTARIPSDDLLGLEASYEGSTAELSDNLRAKLAADPATAALDRFRLVLEPASKNGSMHVFRSTEPRSSAVPVFEWVGLCAEQFPQYGAELFAADARQCGRYAETGTPAGDAEVLRCATEANDSGAAFVMNWAGGDVAARGSVGRLAPAFTTDGRAAYYQFIANTLRNVGRGKLRRCSSLTAVPACPGEAVLETGAPCFRCESPGPWLDYCGNWPSAPYAL